MSRHAWETRRMWIERDVWASCWARSVVLSVSVAAAWWPRCAARRASRRRRCGSRACQRRSSRRPRLHDLRHSSANSRCRPARRRTRSAAARSPAATGSSPWTRSWARGPRATSTTARPCAPAPPSATSPPEFSLPGTPPVHSGCLHHSLLIRTLLIKCLSLIW